jgi:hypothetical protein
MRVRMQKVIKWDTTPQFALGKGLMPDGFEQKDGYRLYKYKDLE